jgi:hypothetical protein
MVRSTLSFVISGDGKQLLLSVHFIFLLLTDITMTNMYCKHFEIKRQDIDHDLS